MSLLFAQSNKNNKLFFELNPPGKLKLSNLGTYVPRSAYGNTQSVACHDKPFLARSGSDSDKTLANQPGGNHNQIPRSKRGH